MQLTNRPTDYHRGCLGPYTLLPCRSMPWQLKTIHINTVESTRKGKRQSCTWCSCTVPSSSQLSFLHSLAGREEESAKREWLVPLNRFFIGMMKSSRVRLWCWSHSSVNMQKDPHWVAHTPWVNFMVCKFYFHKAGFQEKEKGGGGKKRSYKSWIGQ